MFSAALLAGLLALVHLAAWPTAEHAVTGSEAIVILSATATLVLLATILNGVKHRENWVRLGDIGAQAQFCLVPAGWRRLPSRPR